MSEKKEGRASSSSSQSQHVQYIMIPKLECKSTISTLRSEPLLLQRFLPPSFGNVVDPALSGPLLRYKSLLSDRIGIQGKNPV